MMSVAYSASEAPAPCQEIRYLRNRRWRCCMEEHPDHPYNHWFVADAS